MNCDEAQEWITALIDNELSMQERLAIEAHLRTCSPCQQRCAQERRIKLEIRRESTLIAAPVALRQAIERSGGKASQWHRVKTQLKYFLTMPLLRPALTLALALLVLYLWLFPGSAKKDIAWQTLSTYAEIVAGKRALTRVDDPNTLKRQLIQAVNGRFAPMAFDLSGMKLYPVSGWVEKISGRDILVVVYQGEGPTVTCFTLLGSESDAPADAEIFYDAAKKIHFYLFTDDDMHAVMHREGEVICIMVSKMPAADLLALMREKARHA
jgi:anti-sigma factor RsiW